MQLYIHAMLFLLFQVADSLDLYPIPSAYQIRFQGCKGMLTMDPSLPHGDVREILQYRKSMKKFDSSHTALEICEATKPSEYFIAVRTRALLFGFLFCFFFLFGWGVGGETKTSFLDPSSKTTKEDFKIYDGDVDEIVTSKYYLSLS